MKFIKSNLAKKLIIILVALMIFNIAIPKQVNAAWNFSGILMKPISSLILSFLVSIDVQLSAFMLIADIAVEGIGGIVEQITQLGEDKNLTGDETVQGIADLTIKKLFIGPDTIFTGGVALLDANIFEAQTTVDINTGESVANIATLAYNGGNFAGTIKRGIATTYVILRNICAMIMLAGLIFTGIRVLVTANTPTKMAQWRQLLQDWLIGMILLIFSHVLMYGIFWVSDIITDALAKNLAGFGGLNFTLVKTCLMSFDSATQIICLVMLGYLIYLTVVFAISYFKRLLWICVLIVIAPIVSIMYAFGNQTKQIYSKWIREYVTTVLVQPFHLIVYYTLVSVPLNMVSAGTLEYTGLGTFKMIYALGAISFIRPAEKYIRQLFGMNQGLAEKASFDSGKQTFDALADAVKKVAVIASMAFTGGATAPLAEAELAEETIKPMMELNPDNLLADMPGTELYGNISRDLFHEDYYSGDQFFDNDLQNPSNNNMNKMTEEELQTELDNLGLEQGSEERAEMEKDLRAAGHGEKIEDTSQNSDEDSNKESHNQSNINANNVIITAGNVSTQGNMQANNPVDNDIKIDTDEESDSEKDNDKKSKEENEKNTEIEKEGTPDKGEKDDFLTRRLKELNSARDFAIGESGIFESIKKLSPDSLLGKKAGQFTETDFGKKLAKFEELGGIKELHSGFNSVRDTFFADAAPGDWKKTNDRMGENIKANIEQVKFNIVNNEEYLNQIINREEYEKKLRDIYKDKQKYPDARIKEMAKDKAKEKLKSVTETYVPLGIKDPIMMLELDEDRKKYGLSAEESVKQRVKYEKFNMNIENVEKVNEYFKTNNSTIEETIPQARDYYYNGYTDVGRMSRAYELTNILNLTHDYGKKLDRVLSNKGSKINLNLDKRNDLDDKTKQRIKTLVDSYKKEDTK